MLCGRAIVTHEQPPEGRHMTEPGRSRRHVAQLAYAGLALTFALGPSAAAAETDAEPVIQGLDPMTKLMRRFRAGPAIDPQAWDTAPTLTWPGLSAIQFEPNDLPDTCTGLVIPPRGGEIIDLLNLGAWDQLGDGSLTCRLKIRSPEAKGARIKFFNLDLPPGAQITLGTADGEVFGQYEGRGLLIDGEFWAATVPGETTFVEITIPSDQRDELIVADVSELLHEFLDVLGPARLSVSPDGPELSCHIDAACELAPDL